MVLLTETPLYAHVQGSSQSSKRGLPLFSQCSALMWTQNLPPPPYFSAGWIHAYTCIRIRLSGVRMYVYLYGSLCTMCVQVCHVLNGTNASSNGHCCGFFWRHLRTWLRLYVPTSFSYIIYQNSKSTQVVNVQCQANGLFDCMGLWLVYNVQVVAYDRAISSQPWVCVAQVSPDVQTWSTTSVYGYIVYTF